MKVPGAVKRGRVFVVSAPAGTGKTTLVQLLEDEFDNVARAISFTTRQLRRGEKQGIDYHFVREEKFKKMIKEDAFYEYAEVFGEYYGTCKKEVEKKLKKENTLF